MRQRRSRFQVEAALAEGDTPMEPRGSVHCLDAVTNS